MLSTNESSVYMWVNDMIKKVYTKIRFMAISVSSIHSAILLSTWI